MTSYLILDFFAAFILDLIFGDPYWLPHPVRFIGWMIKKTEKFLRAVINKVSNHQPQKKAVLEKICGFFLTGIVVLVTFGIVFFILKCAVMVYPILFHLMNIYLIYTSFAAKCLADEAIKVYKVLNKGDIVESRKQLGMLVGRQTDQLNEEEIIRGVVETTAENTVDGVISPMIYAFIGSFFGLGAPLVYAFKAISTLDSMVGYKNDKYLNLGYASAKLDDIANYIPARITGVLIPISAFLLRKNYKNSFRIMVRDRRNHKSPNCAYAEAAAAGALDIMIGGNNVYFGQVVEKPTIGDSNKKLEIGDIKATVKLMYTTSFVALVGLIGVFLVVGYLN